MIRSIFALVILTIASNSIPAQDDARPSWQVTNFDITVSNPGSDRALNARAVLAVRNIGRGAGSTLSIRLNPKVEVKSITVGSAVATYRSRADTGGKAQQVTITLPSQTAPNDSVSVTVDYRLPVAENTGLSSISPLGTQFLPQSMWYPVANNAFAFRGADYAPFRLTVTG